MRLMHRRAHLVLTAAGAIAGTATVVLPFTHDVSPAGAAASKELWQVGIPFFLAWPTTVASLHWIHNGMPRRTERMIAYAAGAAAFAASLSFLIQWLLDTLPSETREQFAVAMPFVVGLSAVPATRATAGRAFGPVLAMQLGYVANALFCLTSFVGEWQVGAFCAVATIAIYVMQIAMVMRMAVAEITVTVES